MTISNRINVGLILGCLLAGPLEAIQLGLLDDFEGAPMTCSTDGWTEGIGSPNPPTGQLLCGELDTCCLQNDSAGGFGPGSRQVVYNEAQWAGDYIAAGVNKIQLQAANASATEILNLRIGVTNGSTCYVSTDAEFAPPNTPGPAGLQFLSFLLDETTMTEVSGNACSTGGDPLAAVLSNVTQLRIISSANAQWSGDAIVSELQLDAIQSKADSDLDGINDDVDNCTDEPNPAQNDIDGDLYGNACDADLDNDCFVGFSDLGIFKTNFGMAGDNAADFDGDGFVGFPDLGKFREFFGAEPGPGLGVCDECAPPEPVGSNTDFAGLDMYVRGGLINDWGAVSGVNSFSDNGDGTYTARFEANAGSFEMKIADADWAIEYCSATILNEGVSTNYPFSGCAFPMNGTIVVPRTACWEFTMTTDGNIPPSSVDVVFEESATP